MANDLVPLASVPGMTGLEIWTVRRRLAELGAPVFQAPENRRRRLVRESDVAKMLRPRRMRGGEEGEETA